MEGGVTSPPRNIAFHRDFSRTAVCSSVGKDRGIPFFQGPWSRGMTVELPHTDKLRAGELRTGDLGIPDPDVYRGPLI